MNKEQPLLYLLCGLSFAGKSTLARLLAAPLNATIVEADRYIASVEAELPGASKIESWREIQKRARREVETLLTSGKSVIFDDLMVDPNDRDEMAQLARRSGAKATIPLFLDTPVETVRARQREKSSRQEKLSQWEDHTQLLLSQLVPPPKESAVYVAPGYKLSEILDQIAGRAAATSSR